MERRRRLRDWRPRRSDVLFVVGATAFLTETLGDNAPRNSIVVASLVLMGVPVFNRITGNGDDEGKGKP